MNSELLEKYEELSRRAVASKHWRWMPGMLAIMPEDRDGIARPERVSDDEWLPAMDSFPDLLDPATLGCLLVLVRAAWGDPFAMLLGHQSGWHVHIPRVDHDYDGDTEAEALVEALEAASLQSAP